MKDEKKRNNILLIFGTISVALILLFVFPLNDVPKGVPLDYYERIDELNKEDITIFYDSSIANIPSELDHMRISSFTTINLQSLSRNNVVVIDMLRANSLTDIEIESLSSSYENQCYFIILLNYGQYNGFAFSEFIDEDDVESDMVILDHINCNELYYSSTVDNEYETFYQFHYGIIYTIMKKIEN